MPEISRFYGISIRMDYADPAPPHFHALYGGDELIVGISPIRIIAGHAAARVQSMVLEWTALHQTELQDDWQRRRDAQMPLPIAPLE
jgi:hypothetical protein